jgi:hypothetical protein
MPPKGVSGLASKWSRTRRSATGLKRAVGDLMHAAERLQEREEERAREGEPHLPQRDARPHRHRHRHLLQPVHGLEVSGWVKGHVSGGEFSYNGHDATETVTVDVE